MNLSTKIRTAIICSQVIAVLISFSSGLNAQGPSLSKPPSKKTILNASKKILAAVVHLEAGPKKDLINLPSFFPYYAFLSPESRINSDLKKFLDTHLGTGILIDSTGHILTNAFWVNGARIIRIRLHSGKWFNAKFIGSDTQTDLAILKISRARPLPSVRAGNSDKILMGERIIAIGYHDAFKPTLTEGIICVKHDKTSAGPSAYNGFLQTDARIDLQNSGGPLINLRGEVIGINDALLTRLSKLRGMGFAVPWNTARHVASQLIARGKVEHGWLGLHVQDVILRADRLAKGYIKGIIVIGVIKGSPALKAGIRPGDIIISYQKHRIYNASFLKRLVSITPPGKTAKLGVLRHGHKKEISAQVSLQSEKKNSLPENLRQQFGISVISIQKPNRKSTHGRSGVIISWIDPNGPMGKAGFEANDIILEANGYPILTQNDLKRTLKALKSGHYVIFLAIDHRTHRTGYVQIHAR